MSVIQRAIEALEAGREWIGPRLEKDVGSKMDAALAELRGLEVVEGWAYKVIESRPGTHYWEVTEDGECHPANKADNHPALLILGGNDER